MSKVLEAVAGIEKELPEIWCAAGRSQEHEEVLAVIRGHLATIRKEESRPVCPKYKDGIDHWYTVEVPNTGRAHIKCSDCGHWVAQVEYS